MQIKKLIGKLANGFITYLRTNNNRQTTKPLNRQTKNGFTLIELMLVVIIIGVLAAMVMPRLVGRSEQARVAAAKADINANIALALDLYEMDNGRYPNGLSDLMQKDKSGRGAYLKKSPGDPWGREYKYEALEDGKNYRLCSDGPDPGKTEDNICNDTEN